MSRQILIVDSDTILLRSLEEQFGLHESYEAIVAKDAAEARNVLQAGEPDIILLDAPAAGDAKLAGDMAQFASDRPVLLLLDKDELPGFEQEDREALIKPFRFSELLARVRQVLRQSESEDSSVSVGRYMFRPGAKLLVDAAGGKVYLTEKESSILKYLLAAREQVVSRELLLSEVWGYNSGVTTHTLETHIYRLRQKIEEDPSSAAILVTEAGGYRLALQPPRSVS